MLSPIRGTQTSHRPAPARRGAGGGFALPELSAAPAAAPASGAAALPGLQPPWGPAERDAAAHRRGSAVLRELQALQLAFLSDGMEPERLARLAALAEGEAGADPGLREIIGQISLRARIELARRGG